jgi:DnaJ family protein C protein 9
MEMIPHSNYTDEERFTKLLNNSIKKKEIPSLESWKKELSDKTGRARRKKEGEKEAKDAEDAARELGVWDEFYNNGQGKGPSNGEEDYSALKALIQGKKRKADDFLEGLAAKYTKQKDGKRAGGGKNGRVRKKAREP